MTESGSEVLESILRDSIRATEIDHKGWVAFLQSPAIFGGIGPVKDEELQSSTRSKQIKRVVDSSLLNSIKEWDDKETPSEIAAFLLNEFGSETLDTWYQVNKAGLSTDGRRVIAVRSAVARALEENKNDQKPA